jgi:AcrR family transcriptional regulator
VAELDADRIAKVALALADDAGAAGFTMRAVADALGVTPMALYHHVADKAALVALVADAVIAEHALPPPTGRWDDDLWAMARWLRRMVQAHPAVTRLRRTHQVWTPSILPLTERWFSVGQQSGLPFDAAMLAAAASSMAIVGTVEEELQFRHMRPPDDALLTWLPNTRHAFGGRHDHDAEFELVVRSLIEGIHARLARQAGAGGP